MCCFDDFLCIGMMLFGVSVDVELASFIIIIIIITTLYAILGQLKYSNLSQPNLVPNTHQVPRPTGIRRRGEGGRTQCHIHVPDVPQLGEASSLGFVCCGVHMLGFQESQGLTPLRTQPACPKETRAINRG